MVSKAKGLLATAVAVIVLVAVALLATESLAHPEGPVPSSATTATDFPLPVSAVSQTQHSRIAVIVLENKEYGQVIGNPAAPYLNSLARSYASATRFFAVTHPSLPNYLALTSGSTQGIHNDCTDCRFGGPNLLTQLSSAGFSWRSYVAGVPQSCYQGARASGYVKPLNPFVYSSRITEDPALCSNIVPLSQLAPDLQSGALPDLTWITPSLCQDTHQCSGATGDRFLSHLVPPLMRGLGPHGVLFILWDEGTSNRGIHGSAGGGHVPAIVVGPDIRSGARVTAPMDQYTVLRELEMAFGVLPLGNAREADPHAWDSAFTAPLQVAPTAGPPATPS